jgi:beta-lactamase regulating signal transducer with metallopeptidase domain
MTRILISSSVLIAVLFALRRVFRGRVDPRVQYALWGLVLLRLLIPVNLPVWNFSLLNVTETVERTAADPSYAGPAENVTLDNAALGGEQENQPGEEVWPEDNGSVAAASENHTTATIDRASIPWDSVWKIGMAAVGLFFLLSNLRFWKKLRRNRTLFPGELPYSTSRKIYSVPEGVLPSPCLFGNAIYLTPEALRSECSLRHVLCHEETHARHLDPLWSLLKNICLVIYWFDPLVWAAAHWARLDCELACDESVLRTLGNGERIRYGETLLSLVPVRRLGNPLLSATTMTGGKKALRDRITCIASRPRRPLPVLLAVLVLAVGVTACTFTGGNGTQSGDDASADLPSSVSSAVVSLSGEELRWWNEEFFGDWETETIPTQFANPYIPYTEPEEIDLFELFYLSGSTPSDEEIRTYLGSEPDDLPCPAYKLTLEEMDDLLTQYMGLTVSETKKNGLDQFHSNEDGTCFYWAHGDTNYCGQLFFSYGTREVIETGEALIHLYYNRVGSGEWYRVTLSEEEDGTYHFRSNLTCEEQPAVAPLLPEGEPETVAPLTDLVPIAPEEVTMRNYPASDHAEDYYVENWDFDGTNLTVYPSSDGLLHCAIHREDGSYDVFLSVEAEQYWDLLFFNNLFGQNGFWIEYALPDADGTDYAPVRSYYTFTPDGGLSQMLCVGEEYWGQAWRSDLDGNGADELICGGGIYFLKGGSIYFYDPDQAASDLPDNTGSESPLQWDAYGRYCAVTGGTEGGAAWNRYLYFDNGNILIYDMDIRDQ